MSDVRLNAVRKVYDNGHVAVAGATFTVAPGELMVLVGPSGCGKSTLLRMIAGLEDITSGELSIAGRVVNALPPKDRDIAMVFQNYALYPHMTVAQNLAFGLKLQKRPADEIERRINEAAARLGLTPMLARLPRELSGGQRQRVALGRALVRQPQVFLLDEPLSNLDAKLRLATRVEIARLQRDLGATMIYVTHDQIEAMTLGHRIAVLDGGHVQQIDTPMRLYHAPCNLFVAGFLGSPGMNFLHGELAGDPEFSLRMSGFSLPLGPSDRWAALAPYRGRALIVGVRPEHFVLIGAGRTAPLTTPARVDLVEPVGNEVFLNLACGGCDLVARVPPDVMPAAGDDVTIGYDPAQLHFFDPADGQRIAVAGA
jgi:multiple sugar transport system ATP-binding protein